MSSSKLPSLVAELSSPSPSWRLGSSSSESVSFDSVASVDEEGVFRPGVCLMAEFAGGARQDIVGLGHSDLMLKKEEVQAPTRLGNEAKRPKPIHRKWYKIYVCCPMTS
jgi:hypothetical protein